IDIHLIAFCSSTFNYRPGSLMLAQYFDHVIYISFSYFSLVFSDFVSRKIAQGYAWVNFKSSDIFKILSCSQLLWLNGWLTSRLHIFFLHSSIERAANNITNHFLTNTSTKTLFYNRERHLALTEAFDADAACSLL